MGRHAMQRYEVCQCQVHLVADRSASWFQVVVNWLPVTLVHLLYESEHARWVCEGCAHRSGTKRQMLRHVVREHFPLIAHAYAQMARVRRIEAPAYPRIAGRWYEPHW